MAGFLLSPTMIKPAAVTVNIPYSAVMLQAQVVNGVISDTSQYAATATVNTAAATVDTSVAAFPGTASIRIGNGASPVTFPYVAARHDFAVANTIWNVDAWVYLQGPQSSIGLYRLDVASSIATYSGWETAIARTGVITVFPGYTGPPVLTIALASNTWHHVVWMRSGTTYAIGVNGNILQNVQNTVAPVAFPTMRIGGCYNNTPGIIYNLQDVRMALGSWYPMNIGDSYTLPTAPL